jgi:membrane protease YdiL (CAAX protease family)
VSSCSHCGALTPSGAAWCGQCYEPVLAGAVTVALPAVTPVAAAEPVSATAPEPVAPPVWPPLAPPSYAGSDRFGLGPAGGGQPLAPPSATVLPPPPGIWVPTHPSGLPEYTAEDARVDGRLLDKRALRLVAIAIGVGGVMQVAGLLIGRDTHLEPSILIAIDIIMTLAFYGVVGGMVVFQITPNIRLRWGDGSLVVRLLTGLVLGAGLSGAVGHLSPDPRFLVLMSEGDPTHIALVVLLTCVAAPLVEETLFRGLLLEALRPRGRGLAIVVSALAFAVWHFIPAALVYYGLMGAGFAAIYLKRGLATSMAAHAGFNGVLTIAAITIVLAPAHQVGVGGLTFTAPAGWSTVGSATAPTAQTLLDLRGPSSAEVAVVALPTTTVQTADDIERRLQDGSVALEAALGGRASDAREISTPAGTAVEVDIDLQSHDGDAVLLPAAGQVYELIFLNAGSVKAIEDFHLMLDSLRLS